jgi:membrane protein YdbS with pleckstrin-like domain
MDRLPNLNAHRVTHPIALLAFGVGAMLVLLFFGAPWYVVMGVILVILIAGFAVLIKFPQLRMEGEHLYNYESGAFDDFSAEVRISVPSPTAAEESYTVGHEPL